MNIRRERGRKENGEDGKMAGREQNDNKDREERRIGSRGQMKIGVSVKEE